MAGCVHIYCGDGKGKTTASVGLAVRASGAGKQVLFSQFFKDGSSSEIDVLRSLPNLTVDLCPVTYGFYKFMDEERRKAARQDYRALLDRVLTAARQGGVDLLILDEIISSCNHGVVEESVLLDFLAHKPENLEVVLTGRNPSEALQEAADYISEIQKVKHPFDRGIPARRGIEF